VETKTETVEVQHGKPTYQITRFILLRLLGFVYAVAFLVAAQQLIPLIGSHGLLPLDLFLHRVREALGSNWAGFCRLPSIFWVNHSDAALLVASWTGFALACMVFAGFSNSIILAVLWFLYLSINHVGQDWYGYGWESQLCETGFLAIFLAPFFDPRPFSKSPAPVPVIWLFRWLLFRLLVGAALIKLRGDSCWRDLTALYYYFETQPCPNPLSRWFHFLPKPILQFGVLFNFLAELVAPWFIFWPRIARHIAGVVIALFFGALIISGNLSFLDWLSLVAVVACFDDIFWKRFMPRRWRERIKPAATRLEPPRLAISWMVVCVVAFLSAKPVQNLIGSHQIMNTSFDAFELVNTYGAFGSIGREVNVVVFEGSDAEFPYSDADWKEYRYRGVPVDLKTMPPVVAPYQLHFDWQMWFAAMATPNEYPWTIHLVWKLLHNDPLALELFAGNPFADHPPRYVRASWYRYKFAQPGNPEGRWWDREKIGDWFPAVSLSDRRLKYWMELEGWMAAEQNGQ
jgi:lipase maturation factor